MKKRISILLLLCTTFFSGCEQTVTMDGSVGARVDAVIKSYIQELSGAENGWIAEVMTSEGYYRFYMDFTDKNEVTMYTDNTYYPELKSLAKTSTYNIRSLQRPTLSFDTYSYLTIINDPDNNISHGSGNQGLKTDFEFEIVDYTNGVFNMTGRINRVEATLRKATAAEAESVKVGGLMNVLLNTSGYKPKQFCYFMLGETKIGITFNARSASMSYITPDDVVMEASSYTHTELSNDLKLAEPFKVDGKTITGFTWTAPNFNVVVDGTPTMVEAQMEPVIRLHKMLGPNLRYTRIASVLAMYPSKVQAENELGYLYQQAFNAIKRGYKMDLVELDLDFFLTEAGATRMTMKYTVNSYQGWVTYYLKYNDEKDQFTVEKFTFEDDAHGNGGAFSSAYPQLHQFFVGKTFQISWSLAPFGSYSMSKIELVGGTTPAAFIGALL